MGIIPVINLLLTDSPGRYKKTSVQIYKDWKRTVCCHMDASIVPVLLEYIESAKHENRKFLYEAAKLDHFIEGGTQ